MCAWYKSLFKIGFRYWCLRKFLFSKTVLMLNSFSYQLYFIDDTFTHLHWLVVQKALHSFWRNLSRIFSKEYDLVNHDSSKETNHIYSIGPQWLEIFKYFKFHGKIVHIKNHVICDLWWKKFYAHKIFDGYFSSQTANIRIKEG